MMVEPNKELPQCWTQPTQDRLEVLFADSLQGILDSLDVKCEELACWIENGWVTYGVDSMQEVPSPICSEIEFVRDLVRSGLPDNEIECLLRGLPKPFRYCPKSIAYHFRWGWVSPASFVPDLLTDEQIESWVSATAKSGDTAKLKWLRDRITQSLGGAS